jgi:hypothetical protein
VLLFELEAGGRDISGVPVNMASKVAQDQGSFGCIYVLEPWEFGCRPQRMTVAKAEMTVWVSESL